MREDSTDESEFTIEEGILFRGSRVLQNLQPAVLKELYRTHLGITKIKQLARCYAYWKSIDKGILRMVRSCLECASSSSSKSPLHPWTEPEHNWQGPFQNY